MDKNNLAGRTIDRPGVMDSIHKPKTKIINKKRRAILKLFGKINKLPVVGSLFARTTRQFVGPSLHAVKVEVNSYCNQKCRTCYTPEEKSLDLGRDVISIIAQDIAGYSINAEIIGGEPLMREDIGEIIREFKEVGKSPRVSMYTNGVLATSAKTRYLKDCGLDAVVVTLHSHDAKLHDAITQEPGSFEKSIAGIQAFQDAQVKVYVAVTVHKENFFNIKKTFDFIENSLNAKAIFTKYIPRGKEDHFTLTYKEWREFRHWLIHEKKSEHMKEVENFFSLTGSCPSGNYILAVKASGIVQPCPFATGVTLGTMPDNNLWEIYETRFKNEKFASMKKVPRKCAPCVLKHLCGGGCRSASYGVFDGTCGLDPLCGGPYKEFPQDKDVMDVLPIHY